MVWPEVGAGLGAGEAGCGLIANFCGFSVCRSLILRKRAAVELDRRLRCEWGFGGPSAQGPSALRCFPGTLAIGALRRGRLGHRATGRLLGFSDRLDGRGRSEPSGRHRCRRRGRWLRSGDRGGRLPRYLGRFVRLAGLASRAHLPVPEDKRAAGQRRRSSVGGVDVRNRVPWPRPPQSLRGRPTCGPRKH